MSDTREKARQMEGVLQELDSYCAECHHNWACEGCPIDGAKRKMVWLVMETRVQALGESLDRATMQAMNMPMTHLRLLPGGRQKN